MNLDKAISEPLKRYYEFHGRLNAEIPILSGLSKYASDRLSKSPEGTLSKMMEKADSSWRKKPPVKNSYGNNLASNVFPQIAVLGVISVYSAMDDLISGLKAEISRANLLLSPSDDCADETEPFSVFCRKNCILPSGYEAEILLLKYFGLLRNCFAHRDRRASKALVEYSQSKEIQAVSSTLPFALPLLREGEMIKIHPKIAVYYSIVVRTIGREVDRILINKLGTQGIVRMASYHFFEKNEPLRTRAYETASKVLNTALQSRYLVSLGANDEASKIARAAGLWPKISAGYKRCYLNDGVNHSG